MVCNGDSASINEWVGNAECSGDATKTYTVNEVFGSLTNGTGITLKIQCGGSMCNYAKVRQYKGSDQSTCQNGDYNETAYVVDHCWEGGDDLPSDSTTDSTTNSTSDSSIDLDIESFKLTCDSSTVSYVLWSNKDCSSDAVVTAKRITADDKCNTVEFCSQCTQFMVYSTIFAFIASLFIQ